MPKKFDVVISGMSGRFPECDDIESFKQKLYNGEEFVTLDNRRWPVGFKLTLADGKIIPDATGKMNNRHVIDYTAFKMSKAFYTSCDFLNRMILEPSFEAVVDAGINPYSLDGKNVAVLISTGHNEAEGRAFDNKAKTGNLTVVAGVNKSMLSNRVSYALNLNGPSFTNYLDFHGGVTSLAMGYKYVSEGYAEAAIVGALNCLDDPRTSIQFYPYRILSPNGLTRPFDESADGYARSEGVVCFYLQRAEDAKRNYGEIKFCDHIYLGSAMRPNIVSYDEEYLKMALLCLLHEAKLDTSDLGFVEMNAYGYKETDRIESNAIADIFSDGRNAPLQVGSIKSNTGHTEMAAGLMGVLKALLAFECGMVAPNRNIQKLNTDIRAIKEKQIQIVMEKTPLIGNTIAVNSISLYGTIGFTLLQQQKKLTLSESYRENFPRVLLICGRDKNDLLKKLKQIEKLPHNINFIAIANDVFSESIMPSHIYRAYTILPSIKPKHDVGKTDELNRPVWFIFSGMGSQWNGMGKDLLRLPLFAKTVAKCDKVLREKNIDIYHILTSEDETLFENILNAFVGIITVQIGLFEVIKALGIKPDGIIGHSVGENGCAYADGCLSLEQAVLASWARGVASTEVETTKGMMAAVGKSNAEMQNILPEDIQVACHNSDNSCTLSGPAESVTAFVAKLHKDGIFAKTVNVSNIAYHSRHIAPAGPKLLHRLKQVIKKPRLRSSKWISTSVSENEWSTPLAQYCSAEYLTNNLLSPVLFQEGCTHIPSNAICIEFAPHGLLQAILKRTFPETCTNIPLTDRRMPDNLHILLAATGKLYTSGLLPQVNNIFPSVERPVPRGTPSLSPYCTWYHEDIPIPQYLRPLQDLIPISDEPLLICIKENSKYAYLRDHEIDGNITLPPSFFMYLVWSVFSFKRTEEIGASSITFEDIKIYNHITMNVNDLKYAFIMVNNGSGNFEVLLRDDKDSKDFLIVMRGYINELDIRASQELVLLDEKSDLTKIAQFYDVFKRAGYHMGEEFKLVKKLYQENSEYRGTITWNGNWVTFLDTLMKLSMFATNKESANQTMPTAIRKLEIAAPKFSLLGTGVQVPCSVSAAKSEVLCPGITMYNLKSDIFHSKRDLELIGYQFVSYKNPMCQNVYEFLNLCIQISIEHTFMVSAEVKQLLILDATNRYSEILEKVIDENDFPKSVAVSNSLIKFPNASSCVLLITCAEHHLVHSSQDVDLFISPSTWLEDEKIRQDFIEVARHPLSDGFYSLLKRKPRFHGAKQVPVYFLNELEEEESQHKTTGAEMNQQAPHFIVLNNIEYDDISRMLNAANGRDFKNARYLYIMDKARTDQSLSELVETPKDIDLPVSVLQYGEWGTYRNLSKKDAKKSSNGNGSNTILWSLNKKWDGQKKLNYILHHTKHNESSLDQSFPFCYAATGNCLTEQIGFASTSSDSVLYDPYLFWTIPMNWNMEEAVTIPYMYARAYMLLFFKNMYPTIQSVMINVGKEYLLAEAFIAFSLYKNLDVFVTVNTDEEALWIKERFPQVQTKRILRAEKLAYLFQVRRQTKRKGINLVVNCQQGIIHVENSLQCVAADGFYFEVATHNLQSSKLMGLSPFERGISFHTDQCEMSDFLKLPVETKEKLKILIQECIDKGVIVPPKHEVISMESSAVTITKCSQTNGSRESEQQTMKYNDKHLYIIIAGSSGMKDDLWFQLVKWLMSQGARKFVIVLNKFKLLDHTVQLLNQLSTQKGVQVIIAPTSKLDTKEDSRLLLNETEKVAPLEAIFFLSLNSAGKQISNLDELVSPDVFFIGLSSGGMKEFENRRSRGSPAILIHGDKVADTLNVLPLINNIFAQDDNNNMEMLYKVVDSNSIKSGRRISNKTCLQDYLPQNAEILGTIGEDTNNELQFVESASLSERYVHCKDVSPIFALPAVHKIILQPLLQRLAYPVFSATLPSVWSTENAAQELYHSLNTIQPHGPVTLISETWSLALAVKLQSLLVAINRKCKIISLEGDPKNWSTIDVDYVGEIFHFDAEVKKFNILNQMTTFESIVEEYARNLSKDRRKVNTIINGACMVRDQITESRRRHKVEVLDNTLLFERYQPDEKDFTLSISSEIVVINEPNYESLLTNPQVIRMINDNAEFSWR